MKSTPTNSIARMSKKMIRIASGGGTPERPPPEIGKIVVENWCYLPEVYTFGEEAEISEILGKNGGVKERKNFFECCSKC